MPTATKQKSAPAKRTSVSKAAGPRFPSGLGANGRPVGNTGLNRSNGYIYEEFLTELSGKNGIKVIKEMSENDPIAGAMLFCIDMFMRRVNWFVDAAEDSDEGKRRAEFLRTCKDDMSHTWPDFISEILSMLPYGWSYFETLYKMCDGSTDDEGNPISSYTDNAIRWRKFEIRSQDSLSRWEFDEEGGLAGMWQIAAPTYEEKFIPIKKSLHFKTVSRKANPEGKSIFRNAYRPWYFKKRIEEIEGVGVERDLAGLPFAEVPAEMMLDDAPDADKATIASIIELLKNVRRDEQEGVIWPQMWDKNGNKLLEFKLMNSGGTRSFSTDQIITRYEQRMAMVVLSDFLLLGNDSTGSFALSTSKSGMFQATLASWLDVIQDVLNNYAVPRLFRLNGMMEGPYPKFRHDDVQQPSLADLATFVAALAGAGAQLFPDTDLENHFRRVAQLPLRKIDPKAQENEETLKDEQVATQIEQQRAAKKQAKNPMQQQMGGPGGGGGVRPLGKQPGSVPGAPTKTTGPVKSKLPPQSRRRTAAVNASENVTKRSVVVSKRVLAGIR